MGDDFAPLLVRVVAESKGYGVTKLARDTGIPFSTIQKYWNNQIQYVSWVTLSKIAETLECNPKDLISDRE